MSKKLSRSDEIIARLTKEGKVTKMDTEKDLARTNQMNEYMEGVRRDYNRKNAASIISASKSILTD